MSELLFWLFVLFVCMWIFGTVVYSLSDISKRRQALRAAKAALAQRPQPVSRHATLNPAELKAKRY